MQSAFQGLRLLPFKFEIYKVSMFWNNIFIYNNRDGSRTPTTSKGSLWQSNVTKSSTLDVVGTLEMPRNNVQKQPWQAIPSFTCTLLFLGKKCVTEVEGFRLVWLESPVLATDQAAPKSLFLEILRITQYCWTVSSLYV